MPGERLGRVYVPSEDHVVGWRWSRKQGGQPSAPSHLIEHTHQLGVIEAALAGIFIQTREVGGIAKRTLLVCPRCEHLRVHLYLLDGVVGCRGCLHLHYATSHSLRRAEVSLDRVKELMKRADAAKSRKMRAHWERRALAAYEAYTKRQQAHQERREVALGAQLHADLARMDAYLAKRRAPDEAE